MRANTGMKEEPSAPTGDQHEDRLRQLLGSGEGVVGGASAELGADHSDAHQTEQAAGQEADQYNQRLFDDLAIVQRLVPVHNSACPRRRGVGLPLGSDADIPIIYGFNQWKTLCETQLGRITRGKTDAGYLLQDLYKHGVAGEVVKVADGFARNYLIPRKMAVQATPSALRRTQAVRENVEARKAQYNNMLNDLARQIDGQELIFGRRAASTGKLFGSVTTQEIADELDRKTSVDINRRRISQQSLREVGTHHVAVAWATSSRRP